MSEYDPIAHLYDPWSASVTEDIDFYASLAVDAGSPVVELGVGTGRIAVPTALAGVAGLLDLREGDLRVPPVTERVRLVTCPFRAYLHLTTDEDRLQALRAAHRLLVPGGRLVFDIFEPSDEDVESTHARWLEREPGIFERADWDLRTRTLTLSLRSGDDASTMALAWLSPPEWRTLLEQAGFRVEAHYGWFDRRPWSGGEDSVWVAVRPDE